MTDIEKNLLMDYDAGAIDQKTFLDLFPVDLQHHKTYIDSEMQIAILSGDAIEINLASLLIWLSGDPATFTDWLNELLLNPHHTRHQIIARTLQDIKSPSTVPFVEKALATHFDYLDYTCSVSEVIAKWFSHLLSSIGTPEAIAVIKRYAADPDEGIRKEMQYRINKLI